MTEQSRRPAGSPDGGQFSSQHRPESEAELEPSRTPYERGIGWPGTFYAAPDHLFTTAEQVVNFFDEHPPPDAAVAKLRRLVTVDQKQQAETRLRDDIRDLLGRWDADHPEPQPDRRGNLDQAALAHHRAQREVFYRNLVGQLSDDEKYVPHPCSPYAALLLIRAMRRAEAGRSLPDDEWKKLDRSPTGMGVGGREQTHQQVIANFGLNRFTDTVLDPEADRRELMDAIRGAASR